MKKLVVILFLGLLLVGCAHNTKRLVPVCRHKALMCALVAKEHYEARLVIGWLDDVNHVQAQALINGRWEYIDFDERSNEVRVETNFNMKILGYEDINTYVKHWTDRQWHTD